MKLYAIFFLSMTLPCYSVIPENVVICGVCKNVADRLLDTIKIIESIAALFENYRILVYENNSTDNTKNILRNWSNNNTKVRVYSENVTQEQLAKHVVNINKDKTFFRPELIARARNIVLDKAMAKEYQGFPYIIWIDMDFRLPPNLDGITEVFQSKKEWDAIFAYGVDPAGFYWDWYAFRDEQEPFGPELIGHDWYTSKKFSLNNDQDWYPVYSAFGGCGIYKKSSIHDCRYSAVVTDDLEKVTKKIISTHAQHPIVQKYLHATKKILKHYIPAPINNMPQIVDQKTGIITRKSADAIIWRMNTFVYQYPSVCEHVPFHASMIVRGHNKLFINPRLRFTYGG